MMIKGRENHLHIGIFGAVNTGKSSLLNSVVGQDVAVVSPQAGTTTDPVKKSMEIHGAGAVVWIDTAGWNDQTTLAALRIEKTFQALLQVDLALILFHEQDPSLELVAHCRKHSVPFQLVYSKADILPLDSHRKAALEQSYQTNIHVVSTYQPESLSPLFETIRSFADQRQATPLFDWASVLTPHSTVILVTPIDLAAPKGRLILPQVQTLRSLLDHHAIGIVVQPVELALTLQRLHRLPDLVITDSQAFHEVHAQLPSSVPLTSFSILLARSKGPFQHYLTGTPHISQLKNNDHILLLESCTHQHTCQDIGRVQLPQLLSAHSGKTLHFHHYNGVDVPALTPSDYALVIQCGGCMLTSRQLRNHLQPFLDNGIPVSNYGLTIAYLRGIFDRAIAPFRICKTESEQ